MNELSSQTRYQQAKRITLLGALINFVLSVVKITLGITGKSQALVADGIHSLSDLLTDALVIIASRFGSPAADGDHPYGHRRIETAATMFMAMLLILIGAGIIYDAVLNLLQADYHRPDAYVLWIALLSMVVKEALYWGTLYVGKRIQSALLIANAWHHRSDALSSLVVLVGIIVALLGYAYFDTLAALIVGLLIIIMGWRLGWSSVKELVDTAADPQTVKSIRECIEATPGVKALHQLRTRYMSGHVLVDVHILVAPKLSVSEGHYIADHVHARLKKAIKHLADVSVHTDPEDDENAPSNLHLPSRQRLLQEIKQHCAEIPLASQIKDIVIHYLAGKMYLEVLLPLPSKEDEESIRQQSKTIQEKLLKIKGVAQVTLHFSM